MHHHVPRLPGSQRRLHAQVEILQHGEASGVDELGLAVPDLGQDLEAVLPQRRAGLGVVHDRVGEARRADPLQRPAHGDDADVDALVGEELLRQVRHVRRDDATLEVTVVGATVVVTAGDDERGAGVAERTALEALQLVLHADVGGDERAVEGAGGQRGCGVAGTHLDQLQHPGTGHGPGAAKARDAITRGGQQSQGLVAQAALGGHGDAREAGLCGSLGGQGVHPSPP